MIRKNDKKILCSFIFLLLFYFGNCQKDTVVFNAKLIDTVTEHAIDYLPSETSLSILFTSPNSNIIAIAIYEPERYVGIFQPGRAYNIYGHKPNGVFIFQQVTKYDYAPILICDSLFLVK